MTTFNLEATTTTARGLTEAWHRGHRGGRLENNEVVAMVWAVGPGDGANEIVNNQVVA